MHTKCTRQEEWNSCDFLPWPGRRNANSPCNEREYGKTVGPENRNGNVRVSLGRGFSSGAIFLCLIPISDGEQRYRTMDQIEQTLASLSKRSIVMLDGE